jgi:transposase-like protein
VNAKHLDGRRRRRRHSPEFKAAAIAACRQPGISIAAVAMSHGLNANLLRRWVAQSESNDGDDVADPRSSNAVARATTFVPVALPVQAATAPADIRIELRRGATTVSITWPVASATECAAWLREWLR